MTDTHIIRAAKLLAALGLLCAAFWIGTIAGRPGYVQVQEDAGVPADLPYWACSEIVDARREEYLELEHRRVRRIRQAIYAATGHWPRWPELYVAHYPLEIFGPGETCDRHPEPLPSIEEISSQ